MSVIFLLCDHCWTLSMVVLSGKYQLEHRFERLILKTGSFFSFGIKFPQLHSDMDKGDGSIKYILTGEGAGSTFTIDDSTGDIHAIQRLDREVKAQYVLRAQARNRMTDRPLEPESEFIVKIQDINDNEPKFLDGPYQASVPEMSKIGEQFIAIRSIQYA